VVQNYKTPQNKHRAAMQQLRAAEIDLAQKQRAEKAGDFGLAKQFEESAANRRNSAINQSQQAAQLALTAKQYQSTADFQKGQLEVRRETPWP